MSTPRELLVRYTLAQLDADRDLSHGARAVLLDALHEIAPATMIEGPTIAIAAHDYRECERLQAELELLEGAADDRLHKLTTAGGAS